jgi:hypothetical protein
MFMLGFGWGQKDYLLIRVALFVAQRVLEEKNAEVEELQARLSHLAAQAPNIQIDTERSRVALLTQVRSHNYIYM